MLVILHLSIVTDDPREKAYHLKPRLLERWNLMGQCFQ
ncbi:unnamed protein product [Brassica rapa]|uniref:Uncharacterized protein n=1 Tax=Brassica campestris TaxID=3711 RepID=A0A8D9GWC9_BRACM|nr:unnamed protein product [Brassica rapa]